MAAAEPRIEAIARAENELVVRFGQALAAVPDPVIAYLRSQQDATLDALPGEDWPHKPGDEVAILEGPFAGLRGIYQVKKGDDRALLLVELLGRQNTVTVPQDALSTPER